MNTTSPWVLLVQADNIKASEKGEISPTPGNNKYFSLLNKTDILRMQGHCELGDGELCPEIWKYKQIQEECAWCAQFSLSFRAFWSVASLVTMEMNLSTQINELKIRAKKTTNLTYPSFQHLFYMTRYSQGMWEKRWRSSSQRNLLAHLILKCFTIQPITLTMLINEDWKQFPGGTCLPIVAGSGAISCNTFCS